ncbi:MAG: acyltransferase domain-containing protein [Spirochaetales bacterium]|nr:acyltransferase domain-containing protein [Spirochaetales bacterium]
MKNVFLSGGQGSFEPGMGRRQYQDIPAFREALDEVSEAVGEDIPVLCWGGLRTRAKNDPYLSHVAIWAVNYAMFRTMKAHGIRPYYLLGHSLGEVISACLCGAFAFEDACALIALRGRLFAENRRTCRSDMHAAIGEPAAVANALDALKEIAGVYPVNYNTPKQVVFSVSDEQAPEFTAAAQKCGLRVVPLRVGNGCHSPFVGEIGDPLDRCLDGIAFREMEIPVFSAVTGSALVSSGALKDALKRHLLSPVRWWKTLEALDAECAPSYRFIDIGFSKSARGLVIGWNAKASVLQAESLLRTDRYAPVV